MTTHHHEETTTMRVPPSPDATTPTDRTPEPVRVVYLPEVITDRAAIRDSDEASERGDFPCCAPAPAMSATMLAENLHHSRAMSGAHFERAQQATARAEAAEDALATAEAVIEETWQAIAETEDEADEGTTLAGYVRRIQGRALALVDALARVTREAEALRAQVAAVEALADKRDVPYPPKWVFGAEENYCNGYRAMRDTLRGVLATTGEGK